MAKRQVQVSRDHGQSWKYRWVDPAEIKPELTPLEPGDWVRHKPDSQITVIGLRKGSLLYSFRLEDSAVFTYTMASGQSFSFQTQTKAEADVFCIDALEKSGLLSMQKKEF